MPELLELAKPLIELLLNEYDSHTSIIITDRGLKIVKDETYVPVTSKREVQYADEEKSRIYVVG